MISAVSNGWTVTVGADMNPHFVYTNADDVAASVWGLITSGAPEKTLLRPNVRIDGHETLIAELREQLNSAYARGKHEGETDVDIDWTIARETLLAALDLK